MEILYDGIIAFLAAVGLASLIWSVAGLILRPPQGRISGAALVLSLRGEALSMEADVRDLRRILPDTRLVLRNCGLSKEALAQARYLAAREKNTLLIGESDPLPPL